MAHRLYTIHGQTGSPAKTRASMTMSPRALLGVVPQTVQLFTAPIDNVTLATNDSREVIHADGLSGAQFISATDAGYIRLLSAPDAGRRRALRRTNANSEPWHEAWCRPKAWLLDEARRRRGPSDRHHSRAYASTSNPPETAISPSSPPIPARDGRPRHRPVSGRIVETRHPHRIIATDS